MASVLSSPTPARDSIGAALAFVRNRWRLVLAAAGALAGTQTLALLLTGPSLLTMVIGVFGLAAVYAIYTNAALGAADVRQDLPGHAGRLTLGMGMIAFFGFILMLMVVFVAMSVLIGPYTTEIEAVKENDAAVRAIMDRAIAERPDVILWSLIAGMALLFVVTTRFFLAAPATVDRKRILVFDSWRLTRGAFVRIALARIVLLGPAILLAYALFALMAMSIGQPPDVAAQLVLGQGDRTTLALLNGGAIFFQTAVYSALEAGLSANLYRRLEAPPVAQGSTDSR